MLSDPYGSDYDYDTFMGRPVCESDPDLGERFYQAALDEAEHDWWCGTEPPADDLLEILQRAS